MEACPAGKTSFLLEELENVAEERDILKTFCHDNLTLDNYMIMDGWVVSV